MAKTIKQIADELGVSKTAVRKKIENLGLSSIVQTNGNRIEIEKGQEVLIKSAFAKKETGTKNANQVSDISESLQLVSGVLSALTEQLDEKNRQIENLQKQNEQLTEALSNMTESLKAAQESVKAAQLLQANTEQKLLTTSDTKESRWWWKRKK